MHVASLFCLSLLLLSSPAQSQTNDSLGWDHDLKAGLNFTQVAFKDWSKGGSNSMAYVAQVLGLSNQDALSTKWSNTYKLVFGQTRLEDVGIRKTDDEINLESLLMWKVGIYVNPYAAVTAKSQFAPGYHYTDTLDTQTSGLFDPLYLTQSVGLGYEPAAWIKTRLGAALRETFTNTFNQYADDPATPEIESTKIEGGLESVIELAIPIEESVMFGSKLELFSGFKTMDKVVMNAQASLILKASEWFNATISANAINDWQISPRTQLKEAVSVGISYVLF